MVITACGLSGNPDQVAWWQPGAGSTSLGETGGLGTTSSGAAASGSGGTTTTTTTTTTLAGSTTSSSTGSTTSSASGTWQMVAPASAVRSLKPGCLTTTITGSTTPDITELSGTVFAVALKLAAQRVSFTSSAPGTVVVGATYKATAVASSKLAVAFSVDISSTKGACELTGVATVKFTGPGTCVVDAGQAGNSRWAAAVVRRSFSVLGGKPVAQDASYSTAPGRALKVAARDGLLSRGTLNGAAISSHTEPAHGSLKLLGNGSFTYTPRPSFSGSDSFTYTLRNGLGRSTATIRIQVELLGRRGSLKASTHPDKRLAH